MLDGLIHGLGLGLGFWLMMVPFVLFMRAPRDKSFNEKLIGYWDTTAEYQQEQLATYMRIAESLKKLSERGPQISS